MTSNSDLDFSFEEKKYNDMSDVEQQEEDNDIYYSEERENNISYNEKDEENNTSYNEEGEDCGDNLYAGSMSEGVEDEVEAEYWSDEDNDGCRSPSYLAHQYRLESLTYGELDAPQDVIVTLQVSIVENELLNNRRSSPLLEAENTHKLASSARFLSSVSSPQLHTPYQPLNTPHRSSGTPHRSLGTPYHSLNTSHPSSGTPYRSSGTPYYSLNTPYRSSNTSSSRRPLAATLPPRQRESTSSFNKFRGPISLEEFFKVPFFKTRFLKIPLLKVIVELCTIW